MTINTNNSQQGQDTFPNEGETYLFPWPEEFEGANREEYNFILPLGAVKRLIRSYWKEIYLVIESQVQTQGTLSSDNALKIESYRMLVILMDQLAQQGLDGKCINEEVYNTYFKERFEELEKLDKRIKESDELN